MEVKLNDKTTAIVNAKITVFQTEGKNKNDVVHVRNDKVYGARIATRSWFCGKRFALFVLLALLGGYAHYMYDTVVLGYLPNPGIITGIVLGVLAIGGFVSLRRRRELELVVDSGIPTVFRFPLGKDIAQDKVEDLADILVN
jgi:hypothetical protein